jgi:hypothetical protein
MMTEGWFAITGERRNDGANIGGAVPPPPPKGESNRAPAFIKRRRGRERKRVRDRRRKFVGRWGRAGHRRKGRRRGWVVPAAPSFRSTSSASPSAARCVKPAASLLFSWLFLRSLGDLLHALGGVGGKDASFGGAWRWFGGEKGLGSRKKSASSLSG